MKKSNHSLQDLLHLHTSGMPARLPLSAAFPAAWLIVYDAVSRPAWGERLKCIWLCDPGDPFVNLHLYCSLYGVEEGGEAGAATPTLFPHPSLTPTLPRTAGFPVTASDYGCLIMFLKRGCPAALPSSTWKCLQLGQGRWSGGNQTNNASNHSTLALWRCEWIRGGVRAMKPPLIWPLEADRQSQLR